MRYMVLSTFLFFVCNLNGADTVDFVKDVEPILKQNCYKCHYDKKKKGDFSFLTRESILKGGETAKEKAVIPGNSKDSVMIKLILSKDDTEYMPPKGARLSEAEVEILKKWIDQKVPMSEPVDKSDPKKEKEEAK